MKFKQIYYLNNLIEVYKHELMNSTDPGRVDRSESMFTKPPLITDGGNGLSKLEYNFKANPTIERKRQYGYVIYDEETKDLKELFCSCKDFSYRLYYPFEKNGLANYNLEPKYRKKAPFVHNQQPTKITNPEEKLFLCKHLYHLLKYYF
jgi:hypothetical protein